MKNCFYNLPAMAGRPATKEAPPFGRRLTALRKSKGWTQSELGARLGLTQKMVDYYERRAVNPSLAVIEQAAAALEVSVAELLGGESPRRRGKPGPASQLELRLERIKRLPRKDQEFVIRFLDTVLERSEPRI